MAEGRVLIVGATGYIGRFIALASVATGYTTIALVRRHAQADSSKLKIIESLQTSGVHILEGSLDDHDSLVATVRTVDIVISAIGIPQVLDQLKLIGAMKEAKNIKRFIPSEFGQDVDKADVLKPCHDALIEPKIQVRRATEAAGIPHTYMVTNGFAKFHFSMQEENGKLAPPTGSFTVYGDGNVKAVFATEEDIGTYTVKAASDPRALNKTLHIRPAANILSQTETVAIIERVTNQRLEKQFITEEEILHQIEGDILFFLSFSKRLLNHTNPGPQETSGTFKAVILSLMHSAYIKGRTFHYELGPKDVVAHELYPDMKCDDGETYLRRFV